MGAARAAHLPRGLQNGGPQLSLGLGRATPSPPAVARVSGTRSCWKVLEGLLRAAWFNCRLWREAAGTRSSAEGGGGVGRVHGAAGGSSVLMEMPCILISGRHTSVHTWY